MAASADRIVPGHKGSSERQYQVALNSFLAFLGSLNIISSQVNLHVVCNFLDDLCLKWKYRTIATYRSALQHPCFLLVGLTSILRLLGSSCMGCLIITHLRRPLLYRLGL